MENKTIVVLVLIGLVTGYGIGRYLSPPVNTSETKYVDREVIKHDIQTVVKEVVRPDGTKETTTTTNDQSKETKKETQSSIQRDKVLNWGASIVAEAHTFSTRPDYNLSIDYRLLGPFSGIISISTNKNIGLGLRMEF